MSKGILNNPSCNQFYSEINHRKLCPSCKEERSKFMLKDKKHNDSYSNMIPGFSSETLEIPIDILIIAEAHGGGRKEGFREQDNLEIELGGLENYYLQQELTKYHQSEMKKLLLILNKKNINWVFTDLVKCFVWQSNKDGLDGGRNFQTAISHCSVYLEQQIDFLKPKLILSLGGRVSSFLGIKHPKHGMIYNKRSCKILHSTFPSRNTADLWIKNKEWSIIIKQIDEILE